MLVTASGMVNVASDEQCWNAETPMLVTESGIVTVASEEQPKNV